MHSKWCKYVLSLAMVLCGAYADGKVQDVFAQKAEQTEEVSGSDRDYLQWQLKQMEETMQRQQEQIQALKNRIEAVSPAPAPITKEEIKHEIEDYLATDEARKKMALSMPGLTPVYTPDDEKYALGISSADGNFSLNTGARMQFRYTFKDRDEDFNQADLNDINLRRARVYFGGNIYSKYFHYYVEVDADKFNVALRDFYVYWTPFEELNAKIGFFKVPFNRQRMASSSKLLLQDRSIASEEFDQDRDTGFDIYGKPFDGHMEYHAAVFQGTGEKFSGLDNTDNKLLYVLNLRYNPFGEYDYYDETDIKYSEKLKATIGTSVAFNAKDGDEKLKNTDTIAGVVDLGVKYRGFSWNNEYYVRSEDPKSEGDTVDSNGFFTQLGYFVLPKKLELAVRYSMLDPNNDVSNDIQREYTAGVNYYFRAHRSQIQTDFGHFVTEEGDGPDMNENRFRIQYQIIF